MQPDLLSLQQEGEQLESLSRQDPPQPKPLSLSDVVHVEPTSAAEAVTPQLTLAPKKRFKLNMAAIVLGFLVFLLFLAFGWVGYWAYMLNTELTTTQQQFTALQTEHNKLQADYTTLTSENEQLNVDLTQTRADLEKTSTDLTSVQADLDKSRAQNKDLSAQINEAGSLVEILYVTSTSDEESDILRMDRLITASKNKELIKRWDVFTRSPSDDAFSAFLDYLIFATRESLR
jgi:hypothetical protein